MSHILIAEDEAQIAAFVARGLESEGYRTTVIEDGESALARASAGDADLLLLDVGLPGIDGFEVLTRLRDRGSTMPVIMLTARTSTQDTVRGLDAGANDYIAKPFRFDELLARVRSRLRESMPVPDVTIAHDDIVLDPITRRATVSGRDVELSAREFAVAEQFLRNPGVVLSREMLLRTVWGLDFDPGSNVVDVYVRYLRTKLGADHIMTVRGTGYRWD